MKQIYGLHRFAQLCLQYPFLFQQKRLFLGHNVDLSLISTSLQLAVSSLAVAGANNQNGITWSVFCKPQSHKNIITWPEYLNRRLKPTVREAGRKKALVHGRLRWIVRRQNSVLSAMSRCNVGVKYAWRLFVLSCIMGLKQWVEHMAAIEQLFILFVALLLLIHFTRH